MLHELMSPSLWSSPSTWVVVGLAAVLIGFFYMLFRPHKSLILRNY